MDTIARAMAKRAYTIERAIQEDEAVIHETCQWKSGTISARFGELLVSDPTCLAAVHVTGAYSEEQVLIHDVCAKGVPGGKPAAPLVEQIDYGYPYHNKPRDNNYITGRLLTVDGYPIPVFESTHDAGTNNQTSRSIIFGWDGVIYLATELQSIYSQRMNGWIHNTSGQNNNDATVEMVAGHELITVKENTSSLWYVIGSTPQNQVAISTSPIPVDPPITRQVDPIVGDACYYGFGYEPYGYGSGQSLICLGMGTDKVGLQAKVANALTNGWQGPLEAVKNYWRNFFEGLREKWLLLPAKSRVKGYMALMQIMMSVYAPTTSGAFLGAGPGAWYGNYLRDTGFVIKAVSRIKPDVAGTLIDWFANVANPIYTGNSYGIDGVNAGPTNNTDNAPTWLLGVAQYWQQTGDITRMTTLKPQLDSALQYAQVNFNSVDGHILALHSHDFADDAYAPLPTSEIRYESMVDILWIVALERIAPVFTILGDTTRADFCVTTASTLRVHQSDFRLADGRLVHSLKPDGSRQDAAWWFASLLYDAWLLGNEDSWSWCARSKHVLGIRNAPLNYGLTISNVPGDLVRQEAWGPFLGILALLAAEHGDLEPTSFLMNSFPSGAFPEWWHLSMTSTGSVPAYYSHATNFPWSYASILELLHGLATGMSTIPY